MKKQLQAGEIKKIYNAIVVGSPSWEHYNLHAPIGYHPSSLIGLRRSVVENSSPSHTTFDVLQRSDNFSLLRCILHTGRTHQIRVHLEHLGFPILGDKIYGQEDRYFLQYLRKGLSKELCEQFRFARHALHAAEIQFLHPDGTRRIFHSKLPPDMAFVVGGGTPVWKFNPGSEPE